VTYHLPPIDGAPAMDVQAQRFTLQDGRVVILWKGHDVETYHESVERFAATVELEQQAADQLRRVDRLRTAFLTAVSHELRTPLTVVKGATELLQSGRHAPGDSAELLERLALNAECLLTDLLDLNRSTHTPPGTPIEVAVSPHPDGALLIVTDRGEGIPADQREQIFQPFHQGDRIVAHRPGTGIGLSLVAAFAELQGGRAWVDEVEGGGSAFHVFLPRVAPASAADSAADPAPDAVS